MGRGGGAGNVLDQVVVVVVVMVDLFLISWFQWLTVAFLCHSRIGQTPLVVYYSKVGLEMAKLVVKGQNMSPP